jgi:hypothetical protein
LRLDDVETIEGKTAVFQCEIKATPEPDIRFYRGNKELFDTAKYRIIKNGDKYLLQISNVTLDDEDEYSVKAKNKGGSRISRASLTVKCKLIVFIFIEKTDFVIYPLSYLNAGAPKIKMPERYKTTVTFEKDEPISIKIPFVANPQPQAQLFKGNDEIKPSITSGYEVEVSHHYVTIKIPKPDVNHSGNYKLNLSNSLGADQCQINIKILDKPDPPRFLVVENVKDESVSLSWKPPMNDGGSSITNYIVEKLDLNVTINSDQNKLESNIPSWIRCAITRVPYFTDETLLPVHKYQYRVIAENLQGRSGPCEPTSTITTAG